MSAPDAFQRQRISQPSTPSTPQELKFPPAVLSDPEKEYQDLKAIFEELDPYYSALPLSPRRGLQLQHDLSSLAASPGGMARHQRRYSESSSPPFSPFFPTKRRIAPMRPPICRQRGLSESSSLSDTSTSPVRFHVSDSRGLRKRMVAQHPPGPAGNPKLDNSALQGIWDIYRKEAGDYDAAMIDSWNASIDNLILFAGLFSGIITTFLTESYKSLAPPPAIINRPSEDNCRVFGCGPHTTRINAMWFTSLGLSLVSALIAMLAKQWIAGYKVELLFSGTGCSEWFHEACRTRQFRFDGLKDYKMAQVISATPILLHAALMCFSIGLVDFLWTLNRTVAVPGSTLHYSRYSRPDLQLQITCMCGFTLFLYIGSTISAVISPRSPFKTALARLICGLRRGNLEQEQVQAAGTKMDEDAVEWLITTSRSQEIYQEAMQALLEIRNGNMDDSRAV